MSKTNIEYLDEVWNPITGCTQISEGCVNCWAKRMAETRLRGRGGYDPDMPFGITIHPQRLGQLLSWRRPRRIGVCFMGDLFHVDVPYQWIRSTFHFLSQAPHHTYHIITKRPKRLRRIAFRTQRELRLPTVWCGTTVENQRAVNERIPELMLAPVKNRWLSIEPLLEPLNIYEYLSIRSVQKIDWVVIGCESGPNRRPCKLEWIRDVIDQCDAAGMERVFVKQLEIDGRVSHNPDEWPEWARRRDLCPLV